MYDVSLDFTYATLHVFSWWHDIKPKEITYVCVFGGGG